MTDQEIFDMADEANVKGSDIAVLDFAKRIAAAEREECARLAIHVRAKQGTWGRQLVCEDIAIAIRARK